MPGTVVLCESSHPYQIGAVFPILQIRQLRHPEFTLIMVKPGFSPRQSSFRVHFPKMLC